MNVKGTNTIYNCGDIRYLVPAIIFILFLWPFYSKAQNSPASFSREYPIFFKGDTISGTLLTAFETEDCRQCASHPLIIIIPGSGPTNRNGNSDVTRLKNDSYLQLADSLLARGVMSYRYDKPGVGASRTHRKEEDMRFEDNVALVREMILKIRETGFERIYLLGHSEGSLIGILTALEEEVDGLISVAGPAKNVADVLERQIQENVPESLHDNALEKLDSLRNGHYVRKYNIALQSLFRRSVQPYLISWFAYTPSSEIRKLEIPVLIIQGGEDIQVLTENGETLSLSAKNADYHFYPKMNHVLKMIDGSEEQNVASYRDEDFPLQKGLAKDISDWISGH